MKSFYAKDDFTLYLGDCVDVLNELDSTFDMVFADPPYFLSNDGLTIQSGKIVSVNKGDWDKLTEDVEEFNYRWISVVRDKMSKNASIWISGTAHNIFSIYDVLIKLGFKILNVIVWEKTNPPPNFSTRYFTHSAELILWARKEQEHAHKFNYKLMKQLNNGKQMKDVWKLPAISPWEKKYGKHPTQKPLSVLSRIILASTEEGDSILDPFTGSSTAGISAVLLNRKYVGVDITKEYLDVSVKRYNEAINNKNKLLHKIPGLENYIKPKLL